jgi:uncharacterized protein
MRGVSLHTAAIVLTLPFSLAVAQHQETYLEIPHVSVYGTATKNVVPNVLNWSVNVRNIDKTPSAAASQHARAVSSALQFLTEQQIEKSSVQTSQMQLGENWVHKTQQRVQEGYFASTDIGFELRDFEKYTAIWTGLAGLPGVTIQQVAYDHTERIRLQNETRIEAVDAARMKAQTMARTLGVELGGPLVLEEDQQSPSQPLRMSVSNVVTFSGGASESDIEQVAPGTIPIVVRVRAVFGLRKQ